MGYNTKIRKSSHAKGNLCTRYNKAAGSPFLLLDTEGDGAPEDAALITRGNCELVYEDSRYQVYTFASAADVHAAAEAARAEG